MRRSWSLGILLAGAGAVGAAGCDSQAVGRQGANGGAGGEPSTGGVGGEGWPIVLPTVDKIDLLLAIDNSRSMADKQAILTYTIPELVSSLTQINPGISIHVGLVTSSLGDYGSDSSCSTTGHGNPTNDDGGRLVSRGPNGAVVQTYQNLGFLAWDPSHALTPPGEDDSQALVDGFADMVLGADQVGCGFEAPLESWYRFLIDPDPYGSLEVVDGGHSLQGTDQVILDQRAAFLRPDSMVVILQLTDENDCSLRVEEGGQSWLVTGPGLPAARSACQTDPNDPCCVSCAEAAPSGCLDPDPVCGSAMGFPHPDDQVNVRCFDQKRRFGVDFLTPVDRYIDGLTQATVIDRHGVEQPNPLFAGGLRDPGLVIYATVTGVPWQDISRKNPSGQPDLVGGLNQAGEVLGGFMSGPELAANGVWELILGDPASYVPPTDPLMVESIDPRTGTHPITGEPIGTASGSNSINGNEYDNPGRGDLQYACVMPIPEPKNCSNSGSSCDCTAGAPPGSPLCAPNPDDGGQPTLQIHAKAYPGIRQLQVAKGVGDQALVGSICAVQLEDPVPLDYAYRASFRGLVERALPRLKE